MARAGDIDGAIAGVRRHIEAQGPNTGRLNTLGVLLCQREDWAEALDMHLILDNHTFDPAVRTDPGVGVILKKVWVQMAAHFRDRSDLVYYEILNEPHGIDDALWNPIQKEVIEAIRQLIPLAPLHNPANLLGIEVALTSAPKIPQVAVFDTAFHSRSLGRYN